MKAEVADEDVADTVGDVAVTVLGGKVRDGRLKLLQRALKSEVPDDAVSQVPENEVKRGRLPSRSCSNSLTKLGSNGITQFTHCWISVTSRSAETRDSGARIIQCCCRSACTCTLNLKSQPISQRLPNP